MAFDAGLDLPTLSGLGVELSWEHVIAEEVPTLPANAFRRLDDGRYVLDRVDGQELTAISVVPGRQVGSRVEVVGVPLDAAYLAP